MPPLEVLLARIDDLDREYEDTYVRLVDWAVRSNPDEAQVGIELAGTFDEEPRERWRIRAVDVLEWECRARWPSGFGALDPVMHATEHPLLWESSGEGAELFFRGACGAPSQVADELAERHVALTGDWLPLSRFLNQAFRGPLRELLAQGRGSLATGPAKLLDAYAQVLRHGGLDPSLLIKSASGSTVSPPSVITFGQPSYYNQQAYIIASRFECEQLA